MTANEFFENQHITDANSVINKYAHKFSQNDLIRFAEAYHVSKVERLNLLAVIDTRELLNFYNTHILDRLTEYEGEEICDKMVDDFIGNL